MARKPAPRRTAGRGTVPEVIVDFVFDRGLLFVAVRNLGAAPAHDVRVEFGAPLLGLEGTKDVSGMPLFGDLSFLPPGKEIATFLDTAESFFRSGQPTRVSTRISSRDAGGGRRVATIRHNLEIYRDIGYVSRPDGDAIAPAR